MGHFFKTPTHYFLTFGMMALLFSPTGCGAVGPPIPPEKVGIEAKLRKQQQYKGLITYCERLIKILPDNLAPAGFFLHDLYYQRYKRSEKVVILYFPV